ncbi:MAG TPA: hypothetical protein VN372_04545 [Methanospirillum sp.]|nr:hypothetical protein [Methanospirillum sp.]
MISESPPTLIILILLSTLIFILIITFFIAWLFKAIQRDGLGALELRYPPPYGGEPEGDGFSHQMTKINAVYYKFCTRIVIAHEGLYLSAVIPVIGLGGGAVLIPWSEMRRDGTERLYWSSATRFSVSGDPPVLITVPDEIASRFPIP